MSQPAEAEVIACLLAIGNYEQFMGRFNRMIVTIRNSIFTYAGFALSKSVLPFHFKNFIT